MKVKQLIRILEKCDPDAIVILSSDWEGNGFYELGQVDGKNNAWDAENGRLGFARLTEDLESKGYSDEDVVEGVPAVVIWP
jgi:hypothetical protein